MVYDWDIHQQTCYRLYIQEGRPLEDIMDYLKRVHSFTPSKRAFQTQFRRWNFPPKQRPAYKNGRLVSRIKELWEKNLAQKDMLRVLNEEDGFDIKPRELMRVRARNRWLLRVPNSDMSTALLGDEEDDTEGAGLRSSTNTPSVSAPDTHQDSDHKTYLAGKSSKRSKRRARLSDVGGVPGLVHRFPSEMTLDEARVILDIEPSAYRTLRVHFQQICQVEDVSKKTAAGSEKWEAVKARLVHRMPELHGALWSTKGNPESRQLALDVICTDVTKRMRTMESRMTLAVAKNILGINPEQSREMRLAFHDVVADSGLVCKSDATAQQWEDLKQKWGHKSPLVKRALTDLQTGSDDGSDRARALEVLAKDILKRVRDERSRKEALKKQKKRPVPEPSSRTVSTHARQHSSTSTKGNHTASSSSNDLAELGDEMANSNFDTMSEVSHASQSQMAFSPASSSTVGAHFPISLQPQSSNLSGSQNRLPQSSRVLSPSQLAPSIALESQMAPPPLLLDPSAPNAFMEQSYVTPQFASAATSGPVFQQMSTACAIYLRLHPSSTFVSSAGLWIATLNSHSVQELRQVAVDKLRGAVCTRVEGVLKDGKGGELPLPIEQDQELSAYLAHLHGKAPTFNVQLVWKTP